MVVEIDGCQGFGVTNSTNCRAVMTRVRPHELNGGLTPILKSQLARASR